MYTGTTVLAQPICIKRYSTHLLVPTAKNCLSLSHSLPHYFFCFASIRFAYTLYTDQPSTHLHTRTHTHSQMVDFLTLVQNTFRKLQLKVEIVILDRDITNRQRKFGIELYDLIEKQRRALHIQLEKDYGTITDDDDNDDTDKLKKAIAVDDITQTLKLFQIIENEIKVPLEVTRKEINNMLESKFPPLLIQRRKEEFGITIWPIICEETLWIHETLEKDLLLKNKDPANASASASASANNDNTTIVSNFMNVAINAIEKGTKSTLKKVVGKLSSEEREVEACVDKAKSDIKGIENQKLEKQDEIKSLLNENTTLECC